MYSLIIIVIINIIVHANKLIVVDAVPIKK